MDEFRIKNRFEIRLKNERASLAVQDLLDKQDVEHTAFSIINRYIRFVDTEKDKPREQWRLNPDISFCDYLDKWLKGKNPSCGNPLMKFTIIVSVLSRNILKADITSW